MHPTNKAEALDVFERYGQQVSGLDQTRLRRARRTLAFRHHPDRGGDAAAFQEINTAYYILSRSLDRPNSYNVSAMPHSDEGMSQDDSRTHESDDQIKPASRARREAQSMKTVHVLQRFSTAWATLPLYAQTLAIETIGFVFLYNRNSLFGVDGSVVSFAGLLIMLAGMIRAASRIVTLTSSRHARR
jgi:hypothetical protein